MSASIHRFIAATLAVACDKAAIVHSFLVLKWLSKLGLAGITRYRISIEATLVMPASCQ